MATYTFSDSPVQVQFETLGQPFSDEDAFDLKDFLVTKGTITSGAVIHVRRDTEYSIPDPR